MKSRQAIIVVAAVTIIATGGWLLLTRRPSGASRARGETLARTYCQSCHLFPEPVLLDKASWTNGVLPEMAKWLGLTPPDLERLPDDQIVADSNVFPPTPLVSRDEWSEIVKYYAANAPDKLPQPERPKIQPGMTRFRVKPFPYRRAVPMTLMVHIDAAQGRLYIVHRRRDDAHT
jgi:hypothetical protein